MKNKNKFKVAQKLVKEAIVNLNKLKKMKIVRSERYFSDYVEWAVCDILNLKLAENSIQEGWDAKDKKGKKYQIKYRTHKFTNGSAFDQIKKGKFDYLLGVFVNKETYVVEDIIKIPHDIVFKYTNIMKNRLSFRWKKASKLDPQIKHVYSTSKRGLK